MRQKINSLINLFTSNKLIIIIVLIAACLRFIGTSPGYSDGHPDEGAYSWAITMINNHNFEPSILEYPNGVPLINFIAFKFFFIPVYWIKFYIGHLGSIVDGIVKLPLSETDYRRFYLFDIVGQRDVNALFWGREITALFGVGVVLLIYLFGRKHFGKIAGLAASFLVAVNFREVLNSHLDLPDIYNAFFLILSFFVSLKLWQKPSKINYFITALVLGISFSIKYQVFALIPLIFVHLDLSVRQIGWRNKLKFLFNPYFLGTPIIFLLVVLLISPYHLVIKLDKTITDLIHVGSRYGLGSNSFILFSISYLYHYGIGKAESFLIIFGIIYGVIKHFWKSLFLLVVIVPFFLFLIYFSQGGFYVRNFVTIIPICLIFAGLGLQGIYLFLNKIIKQKVIVYMLVIMFIGLVSKNNITNSLEIIKSYRQEWNYKILSSWIENNIPKGSHVAAHSNVVIPVENVVISPFDFIYSFSIDEFKEDGADYAIAHMIWATNGFSWWMGGDPLITLKYLWNKPVKILEYQYEAIALRELQDFTVYAISNPWQAPDADYIVAKIPKYKVYSKEKAVSYDFEKDTQGWTKEGYFWVEDNLNWRDGSLVVEMEPALLPSVRWQSPPIKIKDWPGFVIDFRTMSESETDNLKTGYIYVNFYKNYEDAKDSKNRINVRVSKRNITSGKWLDINLEGKVPEEAGFITICFNNYYTNKSKASLESLTLYKSRVEADYGGVKIIPYIIESNNLFPVSDSNL